MSLPLLAAGFLVVLIAGYYLYGRWIARFFQLDPARLTPAHQFNDGQDFVPTKKFYLLGQHFSAIAAAGPIAGPILACQQFGWLPCLLWIGIGVIFIGAVHDLSSLVASVRHRGDSIAEIVRENIGKPAWLATMVFIWISLIYVIIAFTDLTASTFVGRAEEFENLRTAFHPGGAVAAASLFYLLLSIVMGVMQRYWNPALWKITLIFVPLSLLFVFLGTQCSSWLLFAQKHWSLLILVYCLVASLLPVWLLLQPRGYLGGFILYLALAIGTVGIFLGNFEIAQPAFKTWHAPGLTGSLFPFLFVTIACGACSGFHGLVCSGTTSKQISKESDCKTVGYGAMLMEGFVALIALATVMILSDKQVQGSPGAIYGAGMGRFLTLIIGEQHVKFAMTFGAMAFSTFVFDTLDVATRLGRYILQELTGKRGKVAALVATFATVAIPASFIALSREGSWMQFWVIFGTSNQLLAALTLLAITVWLHYQGKPVWFTLIPMLFVMGITCWSLVKQIGNVFRAETISTILGINAGVAVALLLLAFFITLQALKRLTKPTQISPDQSVAV